MHNIPRLHTKEIRIISVKMTKQVPLASRGHVTNASFKQWVGILLMPKFDGAHKNYHTPEI